MKLTNLTIIGFLLVAVVLTGCSLNQETNEKIKPDFSEEQRDKMMQERLELSKQSCEKKQEEDPCIIQGRMEEIESICVYQDDILLCQMNRPTRK